VSNQFKIFLLVTLSFLSIFDLSANDTFFSIEKSSNRVYKLANSVGNFAEYVKNGFKLNASTLDDAFRHIDNIELNGMSQVKYSGGDLVGCHNVDNFNLQKIPNGRINEVSSTPLTNGVSEIKYNVLKNDGSGSFMSKTDGTIKEFTKTVYNPSIYPENVMKELGYKSFKDAMDNSGFDLIGPRTFVGTANGQTINGYYKIVNNEKVIKTWWIIN
jgi:hypothetical protein